MHFRTIGNSVISILGNLCSNILTFKKTLGEEERKKERKQELEFSARQNRGELKIMSARSILTNFQIIFFIPTTVQIVTIPSAYQQMKLFEHGPPWSRQATISLLLEKMRLSDKVGQVQDFNLGLCCQTLVNFTNCRPQNFSYNAYTSAQVYLHI